jgi:hypothetical protein
MRRMCRSPWVSRLARSPDVSCAGTRACNPTVSAPIDALFFPGCERDHTAVAVPPFINRSVDHAPTEGCHQEWTRLCSRKTGLLWLAG